MKLFFSYLKSETSHIIAYLLIVFCFASTFFLYSIDTEPILYSILLTFSFGLTYLIYEFVVFKRKHCELKRLTDIIDVCISDLDVPKDLLQKDYYNIIINLNKMKLDIEQEKFDTIKETMEYYTIWAHQIKTPISAMRLLLEQYPNQELSTQLFKIEQYVDMVLTYIRSDSISTDYIFKKYSLDDIIKPAIRKYSKIFIQKKITLNYEPTNINVISDKKWLQFVIEQILSNSLKYTSKGSISINKISNNTLVIEDTGIGIASEDLPRICEKGFTGYTGRENQKSTGIGLYLCKRILKNLSHSIKIESTVDVGTKVIISFSQINTTYE